METLLSIALGIGLAAAAGFRVFVPLLAAGVAGRAGLLEFTGGFAWLSSDAALITFGAATVLEILGYYIPWVDNALDTVTTPAAVVAGILLSASVIDLDPWLRWTLAILAGGGAAATFQGLTAGGRAISSAATLGFANPVIATAEAGFSFGLVALAIFLPLLALATVVALVAFAARRLLGRRHQPAPA